jgi:pyridoxal phosphate enzyme (YggS family)
MSINLEELKNINDLLNQNTQTDLLIVTKNRNISDINQLINLGYVNFGENRVQEAKSKFHSIKNDNLNLHLIGPLQTNKVKDALKIFNVIQSLDRIKLVDEILKFKDINDSIKTNRFFIQINIGEEDQKSGVAIADLNQFYNYCLSNKLNITGLMCIPPVDKDPVIFFKKMILLKNNLNKNLLLSMGMSNDYQEAIKYESNLVRIGSKIFT